MKSGATLSMIVRDEADNLRRCLTSVEDVVDSMIVVDTGSTDGSQDVAREFGADVHEIVWPDAFDTARNFGFDLVKTQWTFWLDADEWLADESKSVVREILKDWSTFAVRCIRRDMNDQGGHNEVYVTRLWRTDPSMRVSGAIHENFMEDAYSKASKGRSILEAPVWIWHDGYLGFRRSGKVERNLAMLERFVAENPGDFYWRAQLAQTQVFAHPIEGAEMCAELAREVVESWPKHSTTPIAFAMSSLAIHGLTNMDSNDPRLSSLLDFVETHAKYVPQAMWEAARTRFMRGEYRKAWEDLRLVERMGRTGEFDRFNSYAAEIFSEKLFENIALCEQKLDGA